MESLKKQTKPKNPKKKTVKRKPRKKPAVKKNITQKQTVIQNVKVVVGEMKQRRRQNRSLFHKQPQRQYQQPPTIIYQQAPIQYLAPQSLTPQQPPQQQQPPPAPIQPPQQQAQPQQQAAPITQPTPQPLTVPQTQPTSSPLTQPTAPPQASPVTPTIPPPPPPIQPQTQPTPSPITPPIVPSIEPAERTVTRPTSPVESLTRPAPSLSLMEQIQQKAKERSDRVGASTDVLTEPPKTSQRPAQALSLQEQIQQKAKARQERVNLGDKRKTEVPKGKGSLTTPLPQPKTGLMAEIVKKGKELKPVSERKLNPLPPPKPDEKKSIGDLLITNMEGRREGIAGGSDNEEVDDTGASGWDDEGLGSDKKGDGVGTGSDKKGDGDVADVSKKDDGSDDPDVEKAERESQPAGTAQSVPDNSLLQSQNENTATLDELTGSASLPETTNSSLIPTVPATKVTKKKGQTTFVPAKNQVEDEAIKLVKARGTGSKIEGLPETIREEVDAFIAKNTIMGSARDSKIWKPTYKVNKEWVDDIKIMSEKTGMTEASIVKKITNQGSGKSQIKFF